MKKLLYVVLIVATIFSLLYIGNLNDIKELKVVSVEKNEYGIQVAFENGNGYYIAKTEDGNLWKLTENVEINDVIVLNTLDTKDVSDDVIVDIIKHK